MKSKEKLKNILNWMKRKTYQNSWESAKAMCRRKFIVLNIYLEKKKGFKSMTSISTSGKEEQTKPKASRKKKIIKIREKIKKVEN